jgi:signal transduction histidine kinase
LAAGIAHEINTPTQYVGDNTRFLEDVFQDLATVLQRCRELCRSEDQGLVSQPPVAELISAAGEADVDYLLEEIPKAIAQSLEGVDRVAAIVRSMKDFSHPGGESKQAVDLNRALTSTLTVCRNEWKYVADVVTELEPGLPLVTCLPGECNQVFLNLIINAAHAIGEKLGPNSTEKGTITVGTSHRDGFVEVRIGDTGTGVPEEAQSKLFDPFFTTKEVGRGTGQGLAIAHSIINEKHGGTIRFETEVDRGTTFIISLPVCSERELTEEPTP